MIKKLHPTKHFGGSIEVPGDKSIAHRAALFSLLSKGKIEIVNFPNNQDCNRSLTAVEQLGVQVNRDNNIIELTPPEEIQPTNSDSIDCGNSGTTARLIAGIIAGSDLSVILSGDESLSSRPMKRIIAPLTEMGAEIFPTEEQTLPMKINGKKLLPFEYRLPIASAQIKSSVLLAGLASSCSVRVIEDVITRDHTELMIEHLGENLQVRVIKAELVTDENDPRKKKMVMPEDFKKEIKTTPQTVINGGRVDIPGDISTAAFFFAGAAISGSTVTIAHLGLNPTRTAFLTYLKSIGCTVDITDKETVSGELRGTVTVTGGELKVKKISGETTVGLIDEIPIVAVIAAFTKGTTIIRDASELKVKESDRLMAVSENLRLAGIRCGLLEDGLAIEGGTEFSGADFKSYGDHRIAMAFSIASMFAVGPSSIDDASVVDISCPEFYELLEKVTKA